MLRPPKDLHRQQHGGGIESQIDDRPSLRKPKAATAGGMGGLGSAGPGSGQERAGAGRGGDAMSGSEAEGGMA